MKERPRYSRWQLAIAARRRDLGVRAQARATIWRRALAALTDYLLCLIISAALAGMMFPALSVADRNQLLVWITVAIWPIYHIAWCWRGKQTTPGKRLLRLRLVAWDQDIQEERTQRVTMRQIMLREAIIKSSVPFYFAATGYPQAMLAAWVLLVISLRFRIDRRAWHDVRSHTQVIQTRRYADLPEKIKPQKAKTRHVETAETKAPNSQRRSSRRKGRKRRRR